MIVNFRQGIISSIKDGAGEPNFLSVVGSDVVINASETTPLMLNMTQGRSDYLIRVTEPTVAWAGIAPAATKLYLYVEVALDTARVRYGTSTVPMIVAPHDPFQPHTPPVLTQHWWDSTLNTMRAYETLKCNRVGWTPDVIRLFVGSIEGTTITHEPYGTQIGVSGFEVFSGRIKFDGIDKPVREGAREFLQIPGYYHDGGTGNGEDLAVNPVGPVVENQPGIPNSQAGTLEYLLGKPMKWVEFAGGVIPIYEKQP